MEQPLPRDEQLYLITKALSRSGALICLDNAHLLRAEPQTATVIEHLAGSARRRRSWPSAGKTCRWPGFTAFRLGGLAHGEARALSARLAGPLLAPPLADALIDRTGGSPMLIRLALGQLRPGGPDPAALIDRLEAEPGVAAYLLQATLGGLTEPSRRLLSLLAVFRHPVDLLDERLIDASEALEGRYDVLAGLDELRRKQLVDHPARAGLHPLVRDYCYARLVGAAAGRRQLHRLAAAYCERVLGDPLEAGWHFSAGRATPPTRPTCSRPGPRDIAASGRSGPGRRPRRRAARRGRAGRRRRAPAADRARRSARCIPSGPGRPRTAYRAALARPAPRRCGPRLAWRLAQSLLQRGQVPEALEPLP